MEAVRGGQRAVAQQSRHESLQLGEEEIRRSFDLSRRSTDFASLGLRTDEERLRRPGQNRRQTEMIVF